MACRQEIMSEKLMRKRRRVNVIEDGCNYEGAVAVEENSEHQTDYGSVELSSPLSQLRQKPKIGLVSIRTKIMRLDLEDEPSASVPGTEEGPPVFSTQGSQFVVLCEGVNSGTESFLTTHETCCGDLSCSGGNGCEEFFLQPNYLYHREFSCSGLSLQAEDCRTWGDKQVESNSLLGNIIGMRTLVICFPIQLISWERVFMKFL
eukprot:c35837_g1_i1 orf=234-845(-)